jgi:hypothetical protein
LSAVSPAQGRDSRNMPSQSSNLSVSYSSHDHSLNLCHNHLNPHPPSPRVPHRRAAAAECGGGAGGRALVSLAGLLSRPRLASLLVASPHAVGPWVNILGGRDGNQEE